MVEISSVSVKHFISTPRLATRHKNTETHMIPRISTQMESGMHLQSIVHTHGTLSVFNCRQAEMQVQAHVALPNKVYLNQGQFPTKITLTLTLINFKVLVMLSRCQFQLPSLPKTL